MADKPKVCPWCGKVYFDSGHPSGCSQNPANKPKPPKK